MYLNSPTRFSIGYVYSFVASSVFYYAFNRFFPHHDSIMTHAETGEEIIAANDAKNVAERRQSWVDTGKRPNVVKRFFQV